MTEVIQQKSSPSKVLKTTTEDLSPSQGKFTPGNNGQLEGLIPRLNDWLETHWVSPAYGSCVLGVIGLCLFAAATNTMAGWLYAISGIIAAFLILGAILPAKALRHLKISRSSINPVSVDEEISIVLEIENNTKETVNLVEISDLLPYVLSDPYQKPIEVILPQSVYRCAYYPLARKRGVYHWQDVKLKTATPLGLFWCSRVRQVPAKVVVYPRVLPLTQSPLIDTLGKDDSIKMQSDRRYYNANEGITRALRPYRHGDPTRLIHWRTSARFDEFKVRELEIVSGSEEVVICLDNASRWSTEAFEEAVTAAASLYFYAQRSQLQVHLWSVSTGLVQGTRQVLETLAGIESGEGVMETTPPQMPLIWITENPLTLQSLSLGSRWVLFASLNGNNQAAANGKISGIVINPSEDLQQQLQKQV